MARALARNPKYMTKKQIYNDKRYKEARAECLRLAKYRCQECRRYGRDTEATTAHHIKQIDQYPELAFVVANLAASCDPCHNKDHPEKGGSRGRNR